MPAKREGKRTLNTDAVTCHSHCHWLDWIVSGGYQVWCSPTWDCVINVCPLIGSCLGQIRLQLSTSKDTTVTFGVLFHASPQILRVANLDMVVKIIVRLEHYSSFLFLFFVFFYFNELAKIYKDVKTKLAF